ncbi:hypothetical protein ACLKA6_000669 [Drosophila palustris]
MYKGGFSFGDDDPEYDKSDPDVTFDDLSVRCTSSLDDSWQSTSEEEIIGKQQLKDQQKWNLVKSKKIPTLFLPRVEKIQPLLDRLNSIEGVANKYTTKCIQNGAIRLHCKDMDTYTIISAELQKDNMELHTHQLRKNRGFRIVIRHLHSTTDNQWIRDQLIAQGFQPIFIRVIKHRFSGKPMNLFEVELQPTTDGTNERILKLERLGSQDVIVEKQLKRIDPRGQHQQQQQKQQPITPKQQQKHQQQSAKKQQQQQQQKQQKQKPIQQQQNTLVKGNKNKNNNNNSNSKSKPKLTYSQIAKSGNGIKSSSQAASGPASRHLSQFQEKLRAEQQVQKQQLQQQQQHQEQPDNSLRLALQLNTETIALMGKKMDAMLESIKVLLSNLITDNNTPQLQAQQRHLHLEPIVEIAPPNPNDMSVDATPDITIANDTINYE